MEQEQSSGRLAAAVRRLSRELTFVIRTREVGMELTFTESFVMEFVHRVPGISMAELASRARVKKSNVSTAIASLEDRGLVRRERSETDLRVSRLYTTHKSHAVMEQLFEAWSRSIEAAVEPSERARLADAADLIEHILAHMSESEFDTPLVPS